MDFRLFPLCAQNVWTLDQIAIANQVKQEGAETARKCRAAIQHYFNYRNSLSNDTFENVSIHSKIATPKLILLLVFDIECGDGSLSEEVMKSAVLDTHGLIAALNANEEVMRYLC